MSDTETAAPIDLTAEVTLPQGEVSREDLVKILEDSRKSEPTEDFVAGVAEAPKVEPARDPQAEKVSARIIANRRAEAKAQAEREAIKAERAEVERLRSEAADMAKQAEALKAAKLSPSKALELLGMSPKEFLESLAGEHEPAAIATRISTQAQTEMEKVRAELAALKDAAAKEKADLARQAHESSYNQATAAFIQHVDTAADKYPHLIAEYTPSELASAARAVAEQHAQPYFAKFGEYPDDSVIADYLESQAAARAASLAERRARVGIHASLPSKGAPAIQGQPATASRPRTLTNGASSQRGTAPKPWSQADADAESIRLIEQLHASRTAT